MIKEEECKKKKKKKECKWYLSPREKQCSAPVRCRGTNRSIWGEPTRRLTSGEEHRV